MLLLRFVLSSLFGIASKFEVCMRITQVGRMHVFCFKPDLDGIPRICCMLPACWTMMLLTYALIIVSASNCWNYWLANLSLHHPNTDNIPDIVLIGHFRCCLRDFHPANALWSVSLCFAFFATVVGCVRIFVFEFERRSRWRGRKMRGVNEDTQETNNTP